MTYHPPLARSSSGHAHRPGNPYGRPPGTKSPDRVKRANRNWTVEEPPKRIRDFVTWYVWLRTAGASYRMYAADNQVSLPTLTKWMRDERVLALIESQLKKSNAGPEKVQVLLERLHEQGMEGNVGASRLYLETVDRLAPRRLEVTVHDARMLSDDQLRVELRRAMRMLEERAALPVGTDEILDAEVVEDLPSDVSVTRQVVSDGQGEASGVRQGIEFGGSPAGSQPEAG